MRRLTTILLLFLALDAAVLLAGAELVLEDGQVLQGVDVRRDGELYVIELESGGTLTIPVELVKEVRLTEEKDEPRQVAGQPPPPGPTGIRHGDPETLAGQPVNPPRTSDQLAVLGEPSQFRSNIIDPTWQPSSDWDNDPGRNNFAPSSWAESVIDPDWQPESAFDPDKDVLLGSRSTFRKSIIDPSWQPTDGFSKRKTSWSARARPTTSSLTARRITPLGEPTLGRRSWPEAFGAAVAAPGIRFRFSVSSPRAKTDRGIDPRSCAEQILHARADVQQLPHDIRVEAMDDDRFATLPISIYAAEESIGGTPRRAVFTVARGVCRLIAGDPHVLLGLELTPDHAVARAATAYNAALGDSIAARLETSQDAQEYALAIATLTGPQVAFLGEAGPVLLSNAGQLVEIGEHRAGDCPVSSGKRKKAARKAARELAPPRVVQGTAGEVVEFHTWSSRGGVVERYAVYLSENGKVSVHRETLATHLGHHMDPVDD